MPDPPKYCHRCYWLLEKDSACALCHDGMLDPHSFWFYDLCDLAKCQDDITSFNRFLRSGGVLTDGRFVSSDMPAPPHCGVLLDPRCEHLPEHVCYDMLQTSIESFIRNNYASSCHEYTHWSTNYPLPLGELRKARSLRRSNPPTWGNWRNFSKLPKFPTSGPGDAALVIVERRGPDGRVPRGENNPNEFPDWAIGYRDLIEVETNPPTGLPGRWQVVLFGIADPAVDADDREALRVLAREWHQREQPSIVRHQHALRRLSRSLGIEEPLLERGLREVGQLLVSGESDAIRLALQELEFVRHTDGNGDVRPILDYPLPTIFGPPML
ncbi:MAG: hypothetical protein ACR2PL_21720, partial [Dehalococcoidia bacterium]